MLSAWKRRERMESCGKDMNQIPDITSLSLEQKIGQILCFGWQGDTPAESQSLNAHAREIVEEMGAGSIVLMARNLHGSDPLCTRALVDELQGHAAIPLFVAVDQEGGSVNRFCEPIHPFPGNMALGAIASGRMGMPAGELYTHRQAEAQARELLAVGVNWNFAPVADVNNNPGNPIIGVRSYGENPKLVANLACAAIRGYQENGILACAKHFPGHGDTNVDSHLALPTIDGDLRRIESVELVPFNAAIVQGVGSIMTTHILFRQLDPERPATLSQSILTGLLRRQLGYEGVVITDCLEMDAIAGTVGTARGAVAALKAGADVVLVCHTLERQRETVKAIRDAVNSGELPESRLDEAATRVLAAKRRFLTDRNNESSEPWLDSEHDWLEKEIAKSSITVVRNSGAIPIRKSGSVLTVSMHPVVKTLANSIQRRGPHVEVLYLDSESGDDLELESLNRFNTAIVLTCSREPWAANPIDQDRQARLVKLLHHACESYGLDMIVAAIKEPYDVRRFEEITNYVCTYGFKPCSLDALADVLFGDATSSAALPVTIPSPKQEP